MEAYLPPICTYVHPARTSPFMTVQQEEEEEASISQTARFLFPFLLKIESIGCTGHFVLQAWRTCCMQTTGRTSLSLSTLCKNVEFSRCVKNLQESCAMLSFKPPSLPLTFSLFDKCMNFVI